MGFKHRHYLSGTKVYSCCVCRSHLATIESMISRRFNGQHGQAYLFDAVFNIVEGEAEDRPMTTGLHRVRDISCGKCGQTMGWKYDRAYEQSQKYKEGKSILEKALLIETSPPSSFTPSTSPPSSTSSASTTGSGELPALSSPARGGNNQTRSVSTATVSGSFFPTLGAQSGVINPAYLSGTTFGALPGSGTASAPSNLYALYTGQQQQAASAGRTERMRSESEESEM